jgi:hypothetical protein
MKLWSYVNGEPFLENPHLGIINRPGRKRKAKRRGSSMAKRSYGARHMAWVRSFKKGARRGRKARARRARRNPPNPRRYSSRSRGYAYKRRRRGRRNPPGAVKVLGMTMPPLQPVLYGTLGFALPPVVEGFVSQWVPVDFATSTLGKYVIKIGAVLGLTWAAKSMLGSNEAKAVAIGGGMYVATSAIRDFMPGVIPGLGSYVPVSRQLGSYRVAGRIAQPSLGAVSGFGGMGRGLAAARFARMR